MLVVADLVPRRAREARTAVVARRSQSLFACFSPIPLKIRSRRLGSFRPSRWQFTAAYPLFRAPRRAVTAAPVMGFGRRPHCGRGGWHRGRRPKAAREGTRGRLGTISGAALWGFGCSGLSVWNRVRWRGGNVDCFEFGLERRLKANLRLAVRQGGWFGGVW
jgi:hypothetical protein